MKTAPSPEGYAVKYVSLPIDLIAAATKRARAEGITFDEFVARAIARELGASAPPAEVPSELVPIREAADLLCCSVWTIRRRVNTPGDPLRAARTRMGKQKPMHFLRSQLTLIEREASAA